MYKAYWGLDLAPFDNSPDPEFFYNSPKHEEALNRLIYAVQRQKGATLLTGEVGCGKTLITRMVIVELMEQGYEVGLIVNPTLGPKDLLREILRQLGIEPTYATKGDLIHRLNEFLVDIDEEGRSTVIVIDEAQSIDDERTFEELRLLLNMQLNDRFLLTLMLVGQLELPAKVAMIEEFDQRIGLKYRLDPLDFDETVLYIRTRLQKGGAVLPIFSHEAIEKVYEFSGGIPRRINNICDLALLVGYGAQAKEIEANLVLEAIEDLRWN